MSDFITFTLVELDYVPVPDSATGQYENVAKAIGRAGIRKSSIDRVEVSVAGTLLLTGGIQGKGPCWTVRVLGDFGTIMGALTDNQLLTTDVIS